MRDIDDRALRVAHTVAKKNWVAYLWVICMAGLLVPILIGSGTPKHYLNFAQKSYVLLFLEVANLILYCSVWHLFFARLEYGYHYIVFRKLLMPNQKIVLRSEIRSIEYKESLAGGFNLGILEIVLKSGKRYTFSHYTRFHLSNIVNSIRTIVEVSVEEADSGPPIMEEHKVPEILVNLVSLMVAAVIAVRIL